MAGSQEKHTAHLLHNTLQLHPCPWCYSGCPCKRKGRGTILSHPLSLPQNKHNLESKQTLGPKQIYVHVLHVESCLTILSTTLCMIHVVHIEENKHELLLSICRVCQQAIHFF